MKFYGNPYDYAWAVETAVKQLPTPGFIWPAQAGPPVDYPGSYYDMRPYKGVLQRGGTEPGPVAYSGFRGYRGYGAVGSVKETTSIWFTPDVYDDPEKAVEAAGERMEEFHAAGFTVTGLGFNVITFDETTMRGAYNGYVLFAGPGPEGSEPLGEAIPEAKKVPWWHYGLAAGGGFLFAGLVVAIYNATVRR